MERLSTGWSRSARNNTKPDSGLKSKPIMSEASSADHRPAAHSLRATGRCWGPRLFSCQQGETRVGEFLSPPEQAHAAHVESAD